MASALPSLELQLQEVACNPGGRSNSHSGWLRTPQTKSVGGNGDQTEATVLQEEVAEQLTAAVAELLRQIVALDWALVCRSRVASLLSQIQAGSAMGYGASTHVSIGRL